ncbi:ABC transporter ATP-binding protein [Dongia sp.]|uniref:ABC transporter ATP-binding protein n=1 Tax=Dongia sp. TaxID=1977262 RepID=UPI0037525DD3
MTQKIGDGAPGGRGDIPLLALDGISKRFPMTVANDGISLAIQPGEIHALLGENGAGKSTLVKIIYGVLHPDAGEIRWNGARVSIANPAAARVLGIGMVFQHFSVFEALTVAENIALGLNDKQQRKGLRERIAKVSDDYGLKLDPDATVLHLSVGERQRVEIVRCLLQNPKLLIMDEPTSVLTPQEIERLFMTLRRLASEGCAILYISHKLEEIRSLCERATILRQGKVVAECDPRQETAKHLAELMIGTTLRPPYHLQEDSAETSPPRLEVDHLSVKSDRAFGVDLDQISFTVSAGEVLGIAGIAGNGQTELMAALSGETPANRAEAIILDSKPVGLLGPAERRQRGAGFVPEERHGHGAVKDMTLGENALLSAYRTKGLVRGGLVDMGSTMRFAAEIIKGFAVRSDGPAAEARSLSGGNLQRFIVGREIMQQPGVLVVAQPTWGVDAGAAVSIRQALLDLAGQGAAVVVISQDLDELMEMADHIAVIANGRLSAPRAVGEVTVAELGLLMGGIATQPQERRHAVSA